MNSYLLQRLICRAPIRNYAFNSSVLHKNFASVSSHRLSSSKQPTKSTSDLVWTPIYKFPYIVAASRLASLRKFQYLVTCIACPATYALEYYQYLPENIFLLTLNLTVSFSVTLTLCSFMIRRLVGFVYVDENREHMKLAYLTFSGKREDKVVKIEDVKTFSETQKFKYQYFRTVATYNDDTKYKLIDLGGILRRDDFEMLFGSH